MVTKVGMGPAKEGGNIGHAAFVFVFAAILCSGVIVRVAGLSWGNLIEKRELSAVPNWPSSLKQWEELPSAWDRYASDNFGLRNGLIAWNSYIHYKLGVSAQPKLMVGNQGWIFYVGGDINWDFFRGANGISDAQCKAWLDRMEQRQKWLAERGIRYVILPAPVKPTIYPERLPYWVRQAAGKTIVDQLVSAAAARHINLVDVRQQLMQRKLQSATYTAYDTHWTSEGAFIGYRAVMEKLGPIPGLVPLTRDTIQLSPTPPERIQQDMLLMLGVDRFMRIQGVEYVPRHAASGRIQFLTARTDRDSPQLITTGVENTSRIMLVRDSYATAMLPFFNDTFGSLLVTHVQDGSFPQAYIEQYRPDIVLLEVQKAGLGAM
ncbi:MAG: hypothetical protein NTW28_27605 [Candidatus Solibacter sp.]|nr:hypothetical protein [Candidatus Solibacter sp.]